MSGSADSNAFGREASHDALHGRGAKDDATAAPVHPAVAAAFDSLREVAAWVLLRGGDQLDAPRGDLDLLVKRDELSHVQHALFAQGFVCVPSWGRASHRFFVAFDRASGIWIKLDVVTELSFGRRFAIRTEGAGDCLGRRVAAGPVALLAPDDWFWALLFHCILDRGDIPSRHADRLAELAEKASAKGPLAQFAEAYSSDRWTAERMIAAARERAWSELVQVGREIGVLWPRSHRRRFWSRVLGDALRTRMRPIEVALRARGRRVALLGPDGAGKSTLSAAIRDSFYFPVRTFYAGLAPATDRARYPFPGIRLARLLFRLRLRSAVARWHQLRGRLVVFDRYSYDVLTQPPAQGLLRFRRRLLASAAARPDVTVVLDAPAAVIYERKSEYGVRDLETQRQRFLRLRDELPELAVVDAAAGLEEARRAVVHLAWEAYRRHLHASGRRPTAARVQ